MRPSSSRPAPSLLTEPEGRASYQHVLPILSRLRDEGFEVYLVGGGIRDLLLQRVVTDWDLATSATPETVLSLWPDAVPTGLKHGTVSLFGDDGCVEITTYRTEGPYSDGRRPDWVELDATLEEDLARRDFTINAMAFDPVTGDLADPQGGMLDLEKRLLRSVGDPDLRFAEDGLRPLRGIRLASVLGFTVEAGTLAAMGRAGDRVKGVAAERIRDELGKLLVGESPSLAFDLLLETGLLAHVVPELLEGVGVDQNRYHRFDVYRHTMETLDAAPADRPLVRWAALLHDVGKPRTRKVVDGEGTFHGHERVGAVMAQEILDRLRLSRSDRDHVCHLVAEHMFHYTPEWTDSAVRRFLGRVGDESVDDLFVLRRADDTGNGMSPHDPGPLEELGRRIQGIREREEALKVEDLAVDGHDVMRALSLKPGPWVGRILGELLNQVLEDPGLNDRDILLGLAQKASERLDGDSGRA